MPQQARVRILHVFGRLVRAGAQMRTLDLLRCLGSSRYEFHFCSLADAADEDMADEIRGLGGREHVCRFRPWDFSRRFSRLLDQHRFDVVHSHVYYWSGWMLRTAARCGVPIRAAHFRSTHDGRKSTAWRRLQHARLRHWIDRHATHILAVSEGAMSSLWGNGWPADPRCQVIYNGLDPSAFSGEPDREGVEREFGLPPRGLLCVHVGRITEAKNHQRLVSIFAELSHRDELARLLLVGWDASGAEEELRRRVAELGIADRVILAGKRTDVPRLLAAADVLVLPSLWEGLPGVVLEACASGTPVVASDLDSIREISRQLIGIHRLPLAAPDAAWALAVQEMGELGRSVRHRLAARQSFAASLFTIDRCAESMCRVWEGKSRHLGGRACG